MVSVTDDLEPGDLFTVRVQCPGCGADIREKAWRKNHIVCFCCGRRVRVGDRNGEPPAYTIADPLFLPAGSVRAMVTLIMSLATWILLCGGRRVPDYLFGLLLTVIAYYFAQRQGSGGELTDRCPTVDRPLYLPEGSVRYLLAAGFAVSAIVAASRFEWWRDLNYLEFFIILTGLLAGYIFAKLSRGSRGTHAYGFFNHAKALAVLTASIMAAALVLVFDSGSTVEYLTLGCCCVISFYFGSKSQP